MRLHIILSILIFLSACSGVKDDPLPQNSSDPALSKIVEKLGDEDKKLLAGYLIRREMAKTFGGGNLPDNAKTVGEALDAQREWVDNLSESERKAAELKAEVEQKRKVVAEQIAKTVTVAFLEAEFFPSSYESGRYSDYEALTFAVHNAGQKSIKALKGEAIFIDTFGDEFVRLPMQFEDVVKPGEKKTMELGKEINKFLDYDKKVMQLDNEKKFRFEPEQIVYEDGSTLRAPDRTE
jgi:hypothetical protein